MARRMVFGLVVTLVFATSVLGSSPPDQAATQERSAEAAPSFEETIKPLLETKCVRCHSEKTPKAELDLSTVAGLEKGGESGPVVVGGKPEESPLFEKIESGEMPPDKKDPLSESQIAAIRRWIEAGAKTGEATKTHAETPTLSQNEVVPIVLRHCIYCHGRRQKQGELDLSTLASMLQGGKSGPAIVLGKPEESLLIQRVRKGQMPPPTQLVEGCVKPVDASETETLAQWIAAGAPEIAVAPDIALNTPDPLVSDKDRDFWSFKPPIRAPIPTVAAAARVRNPIDAFLLQKLEAQGLSLAPEADRASLFRRACFDLTGLPPEPEEVNTYLVDERPDAYERWIDKLLASPRYGERWGRFWLDLAGYSDSEGKREQDLPRPQAWRYRDYVIKSLNSDKPYDRFLMEQLAGDDLVDYEHAPEITEEIADNLIATGFLRMAPDASWANITGYAADRVEVIADEIDILGSVVMGLTMKCARCHSHKFDPIPHRDYYRLVDVFKGALDEYDWLKPDIRQGLGPVSVDVQGARLLPFVTTVERKAWEANEARITEECKALRASTPTTEATAQRISALEAERRESPAIQALWDRGAPSPTYIYRRGDLNTPSRQVGPGVPSVLTDGKTPFEVTPPYPGAKSTGRRLAFAKWLTSPDHPLTARVVVNRIWKQHFGSGIVKTLGNFGKAGTPPTHPELLDWLSREFIDNGWHFKAMHKLMMTSAAYRQSSDVSPKQESIDRENLLLSRMPLKRLDAESLYDTLLSISGRLVNKPYGPADGVDVRGDGLVTPTGTPDGWRRMVYVRQARKQLPTHLENFDYPQMNPNCIERRDSIVALQALELMNAGMIRTLADGFAKRVRKEAGGEASKQIDRIYLLAMSRKPTENERKVGLESLRRLTESWSSRPSGTEKTEPAFAEERALATYCHAMMNSASLLYLD